MQRLSDPEQDQKLYAFKQLKQEIQGATSTMTSVPKPLKFLSPHYNQIKDTYTN